MYHYCVSYCRHIREHLDGMAKLPDREMSEDEMQFHYFKLHDYDDNNRLDGTELISAMTHYHHGRLNHNNVCFRIFCVGTTL